MSTTTPTINPFTTKSNIKFVTASVAACDNDAVDTTNTNSNRNHQFIVDKTISYKTRHHHHHHHNDDYPSQHSPYINSNTNTNYRNENNIRHEHNEDLFIENEEEEDDVNDDNDNNNNDQDQDNNYDHYCTPVDNISTRAILHTDDPNLDYYNYYNNDDNNSHHDSVQRYNNRNIPKSTTTTINVQDLDHHNYNNQQISSLYHLCKYASTVSELDQIIQMISTPQIAASISIPVSVTSSSSEVGTSTSTTTTTRTTTAMHLVSENHNIIHAIYGNTSKNDKITSKARTIIRTCSYNDGNVNDIVHSRSSSSLLSNNCNRNDKELLLQHVIEVVQHLYNIYPPAIITTNDMGYIPFEENIHKWVNKSLVPTQDTTSSSSNRTTTATTMMMQSMVLPSTAMLHNIQKSVTSKFIGYQNFGNHNEPTITTTINSVPVINSTTSEGSPRRKSLSQQQPSNSSIDGLEEGKQQQQQQRRNNMNRPGHNEKENQNKRTSMPTKVRYTSSVRYSITILSMLLDYIDTTYKQQEEAAQNCTGQGMSEECIGSDPSQNQRSSRRRRYQGRTNRQNITKTSIADQIKQHTNQDMKYMMIQIIAGIPDIMKVCLLVDNPTIATTKLNNSEQLFHTSLLQNIMIHKNTLLYQQPPSSSPSNNKTQHTTTNKNGRWFIEMIQHPTPSISNRAIDYLHMISSIDICRNNAENDTHRNISTDNKLVMDRSNIQQYHIDCRSDETQRQEKRYSATRSEYYNELSQINDFVPSLLSLKEKQIEDVATTIVVQEVLDRIISRPFVVTIVFCDGFFLLILLVGFRCAVNALLLGRLPRTILQYIYLTNLGTFYFVIREIGKVISIYTIILRQVHVYFTFWNMIDLLTTIFTLVSTICIRQSLNDNVPHTIIENTLRSLCAIATGFIWLRVLSYLKGLNMQLATFVLAILQIGRDLLWFAVILFVVVLMFSQMFFTLMAPNECSSSSSSSACTQSEYHLKVYAILLGDFGLFRREDFTSLFSIFLAVFFTFFTTTILLNILIAVASDSYEKCLMRSNKLFGRARILMVAELVSFQNLLNFYSDSSKPICNSKKISNWSNRQQNNFCSSKVTRWSRSSMMFFVLSFCVTLIWTVGEIYASIFGSSYSNIWMSLGSVAVNAFLLFSVIIFVSKEGYAESQCSSRNRYRWYLQQMMVRLLGSSGGRKNRDIDKGTKASIDSLWQGRLYYLRNEMVRLSSISERKWTDAIESLTSTIDEKETRLRNDILSIFQTLKNSQDENQLILEMIKQLVDPTTG